MLDFNECLNIYQMRQKHKSLDNIAKELNMNISSVYRRAERGESIFLSQDKLSKTTSNMIDNEIYESFGIVNNKPTKEDLARLEINSRFKKAKKVLTLPDLHIPYNISMNGINKFIADYKPDVIIYLGDVLDLPYFGKYDELSKVETGIRYKPECKIARELIEEQIRLGKSSEVYYLEGNHEFRVNKYLSKHPEGVGSLEVPNMLKLKELGVQWKPENELLQIGELFFTHGYYYNISHTQKHLSVYNRNIIYAHTHQIQIFSGYRAYDRIVPYVAKSIGCLTKLNPSYLRNKPNSWSNAFHISEIEEDGQFFDQIVDIKNDEFRLLGSRIKYKL